MSILILGAGGHAKVIADILLTSGEHVLGYLDDETGKWGTSLLGLPILGPIDSCMDYLDFKCILAIGLNHVRYSMAVHRLGQMSLQWASVIHASAFVAASAGVGPGSVVAAQGVINPDSRVGQHVIVNTAATVDHDCTIGDFVHVAPGAHLGGGVRVGDGTLVGIGSTVLPYRTIGTGVVIGAGTIVSKDIPDNVTVVGNPGRVIKRHNNPWPQSASL